MTRLTRLFIVVALLAPLSALAQSEGTKKKKRVKKESVHDQFSGQGYGVAGCGLGSVVFGPKPGLIQIVAATLNGTGGNQTFGITSGTSNCDIPEMGQQAAAFIEVNREILAKDAARGSGETVAGLAYIFKCSDPAAFGRGLQQNYERIFSTTNDSYQSTREIMSTIQHDQALQASCQTLG